MIKPRLRVNDTTVSSLSLIIIGAAILLVIGATLYYAQQERQRKAIDEQTSRTNQLIEEVKTLSETNMTLNEQNRNYTYCNAVLFAKYTQDQQPLYIEDLNKCVFRSFARESAPQTETQSTPRTPAAPQSNTRQNTPPQANNPVTPPSNPNAQNNPSNQILSLDELLQLNTPCVKALNIISTCN